MPLLRGAKTKPKKLSRKRRKTDAASVEAAAAVKLQARWRGARAREALFADSSSEDEADEPDELDLDASAAAGVRVARLGQHLLQRLRLHLLRLLPHPMFFLLQSLKLKRQKELLKNLQRRLRKAKEQHN